MLFVFRNEIDAVFWEGAQKCLSFWLRRFRYFSVSPAAYAWKTSFISSRMRRKASMSSSPSRCACGGSSKPQW